MRTHARSLFLALVMLAGCYRSHAREVVDGGAVRDAPTLGPALDVLTLRPSDAANDASRGRLCGCPGDPRAEYCSLPELCCPATNTCEDPSRFNCTGPTPPPCR